MKKLIQIDRRGNIAYIPAHWLDLNDSSIGKRLLAGETVSWEDILNESIGKCPDPGTEQGREEATNRLNSEAAQEVCEFLNHLTRASKSEEFSENSTFSLVDLDDVRLDKAEEAIQNYDFGEVVKDMGSWEHNVPNEWVCSVFLENGDNPSTKVRFAVRFHEDLPIIDKAEVI